MAPQEIIIGARDVSRHAFDCHAGIDLQAAAANGFDPEDSVMHEPEADPATEDEPPDDDPEASAEPAPAGPAEDPAALAALAALVRRVMHQDEAALAELYRALSTRVFRQVSRLVRDIGTAEEVVEDVFWQVWRQAPRFDPQRGTVVAWIMQMSRSRALDALRACGRHPLLTALDVDEVARMPAPEDADPPALHAQSRLAEQVQKALALLDPLRRQLISLAYERGYSQSEIAEQMGLPLGTVKSHMRRALATMKTTLESTLAGTPEGRA